MPTPSQSCTLVKNTVLSLPKHLYCHAFESCVTHSHTISLNSTHLQGPRYSIQIQLRNITAAYMACFKSFSLVSPLYCMQALFLFFLMSTTSSLALVSLSHLLSAGTVSIFRFFLCHFYSISITISAPLVAPIAHLTLYLFICVHSESWIAHATTSLNTLL